MTATTSSSASMHSPAAVNEPAAHQRVVPSITLPHLAGIDLADGFTRPWKPVRRSPAYAASIAVVSLLMLVVPALYLCLVAAIGYATYWHAVHHFHWLGDAFSGSHSRGAVRLGIIIAGAIYVAPLLAGLVLLLLVLRPVLLSGGRSSQHFTIEPAEEPALHAFVSALCQYIGAPEPRRIDIDSSVNASASFRRGWLSLLSRGDLVLTIGTPLIAGMNVTQFAGVLAHEFGHFTQGAAMRGTYVIDSINRWLARIVYERTNAEAAIAQFAREQSSAWASVAHILVSIGAWITRMFFKVLLYAAHAISCIMARRMEFDADRHQARLIGAAEFSKAWRRMLELEEGNRAAFRDLAEYFRKDQLPDDLASLIQSCSRRLGSDAAHRIAEQLSDPRTPMLATHPSIASRIAAAERGDESPSFACEQPATILFRSFDDVSRKASYAQYKHELGGALFTMTLVPTQTLLKSYAQLEQHTQELVKYVGFPPADSLRGNVDRRYRGGGRIPQGRRDPPAL